MSNAKIAAAVCGVSLAATTAAADVVSLGASNDTWIRDGFSYTITGVDPVLDARLDFVPYIQFDLSGLDIATLNSATLSVNKVASARNDGINQDRFAVYGLTNEPDGLNTLQFWDESDEFVPGEDPAVPPNGLDFRNVGFEYFTGAPNGIDTSRVFNLDADAGADVTESVDNDVAIPETLTGPDLVTFLEQRLDDNGLVTFMLPVNSPNRGFGYASKENPDPSLHPMLTLDFDPISTGLPGDANGDGVVDLADFGILRSEFGGSGGMLEADFNDDMVVDLADFGILRANFGSTADVGALDAWYASVVPEPTSLALAGLAGVGLLRRRR